MKKLSFILAMIIALSGIVGLFAAPAYAADAEVPEYDYTVGTGGDFATLADAIAKVRENEAKASGDHWIEILSDLTETVAPGTYEANVTIFSDAEEAEERPTINVNISGGDTWLRPKGDSMLAVIDVDINIASGHDVVFIDKGTKDNADVFFWGCNVVTAGRFYRVNAGETYENSEISLHIYDCDIYAKKVAIQYNNRGPKSDKPENVYFDLTILDSAIASETTNNKQGVFLINAAYADLSIFDTDITAVKAGGHGIYFNRNSAAAKVDIYMEGSSITLETKTSAAIFQGPTGEINATFVDCEFVGASRGFMLHGTKGINANYVFDSCYFETGRNDDYGAVYLNAGAADKGTATFYNCEINSTTTKKGAIRVRNGYDVTVYGGIILSNSKDSYAILNDTDATGDIVVYGAILANDLGGKVIGGENVYVYTGAVIAATETDFVDVNAAAAYVAIEELEFEDYEAVYEISLAPDGIDVNGTTDGIFKVKGVQLLNGTTADSASTVVRVLFQIKASEIDNFDNYGFWYSTDYYADCMNLNGECYMPETYDGSLVSESARANLAYTSVIAGGETVAADDGYLYIPLTINVSAEDFDTDLYVRAFAQKDGMNGLVVSDMVTINLAELFPALAK